jgi:nucleoside-diphosphate-sugar epimerase
MRVAVTGATGFTGGHTLKELVASGHEPVAFVRSRSKLDAVIKLHDLPDIEFVKGDITSPESLRPLLRGCEAVIHTAAVAATGKKAIPLIKKVNAAGSRNVLELSVEAGLDPVIYVSSQSVLHPPPGGVYTDECPISQSPIDEGELVARKLQGEGHPVVIIWPSGIIGPDDVGVSVAAKGIARLLKSPVIPLPRTGGILMHDVRDLARVLCRCLTANEGPRKYGVFGHYLDWPETEHFLESVTGKRLRTITLPNSTFHAFGKFGDLIGNLGIDFPLDLATSKFMTSLTPGIDARTRTDLEIEWRPLSESFIDTLWWLVQEGKIPKRLVPKLVN